MKTGKLRHFITIRKPGDSSDEFGQPTDAAWTDFKANVRASAEPLQGREFHAAQAAQSEVTVRFRLRYLAGVTSDMRVVWNGETYEIQGEPINPNGRNRELILMTKKVA